MTEFEMVLQRFNYLHCLISDQNNLIRLGSGDVNLKDVGIHDDVTNQSTSSHLMICCREGSSTMFQSLIRNRGIFSSSRGNGNWFPPSFWSL
ncbi:hypothetical protein WR25_07569 [Diploscapter pachys]|uniref:Uncharacterized protein n=1 Tax=Diploscapter pachys TaxID=2018661 RepID=A0A2A2LQ11_9BILA|nr:hypothetical protein WR25_07569 [Diploscapter pachys]